ncbi:MAG: alpha/beta hydrolase [Dehalococcoidia bacterium]|nr:alpha/beta hydrolase [Dehalococcoidia bacterium]
MADGLLLLHAFPLDHTMWSPQVEGFRRSLTVMTPDFPGFGGTPLADAPSMDTAADIAAEALRNAGVERAVVCGLSMGGYVALAFWRRHRALVSGLVFANTRAGSDDEAGKERRRALAARLRSEGQQFLANDPPPLLSHNAPGELMTWVKNNISSQPAEAIAAASEAMANRPDSTPDLATISVPTLIISSSDDTLIPPDASREMANATPNARFELIERAGHLSNMEAPDAFNELLREQLIRVGFIKEGRPKGMRTGPNIG